MKPIYTAIICGEKKEYTFLVKRMLLLTNTSKRFE